MPVAPEVNAFDRGIRPLLQIILPGRIDEVLRFRPDPNLLKRIEELAAKSTEGLLTNEERAEYEGYVRANNFIAILRRQAQRISEPKK